MRPHGLFERYGAPYSTLGAIIRAAGGGAAGFRPYVIPKKDDGSLTKSLGRTLELPDSEDEDSERLFLRSTGIIYVTSVVIRFAKSYIHFE